MDQNYFFIDGSALLSQVRTLWKNDPNFNWRRLDPLEFIKHLQYSLPELGSANYKRAEFYFPVGELNIDAFLLIPKITAPGLIRDVHFKYCGEKLPKSSAYEAWLETVPEQWKDRCVKSEKGVDIEICCDALRLASLGKMDRLFLFTNDRDFIPLCKTLKGFGVNVSLIHLSKFTNPNKLLIEECDSYDHINSSHFEAIFEAKASGSQAVENSGPVTVSTEPLPTIEFDHSEHSTPEVLPPF